MLLQNLSMSGSVTMVLISLPIAKPVIISFSPSPSTSTKRILDSEPGKKEQAQKLEYVNVKKIYTVLICNIIITIPVYLF